MNRILDITAHWLDKKTDDGLSATWIKGKYLYMTNSSPDSDIEYATGHLAPRKFRFLGYCVNQYAVRIATLKYDNWGV